jgi:hypothetical protein
MNLISARSELQSTDSSRKRVMPMVESIRLLRADSV